MRERVMSVVAELGYKVNQQARQLAGRRALHICLFNSSDFDSEPNSYYNAALELGATRAAIRLGAHLQTHVVNQNDPGAADEIAEFVEEGDFDRAILTPPFADDAVLLGRLEQLGCRVVGISAGPEAQEIIPSVGIDDWQAGFAIGEHLAQLGHRQFGFILGLERHLSAELRFQGFLHAIADHGIGPDAVQSERGGFTFRSGLDCADRLLADYPAMTALVCANDDMAAGALLAAHRRHMEIPDDIAITGFDDTPVSEIVWPPLTTIHQPLRQIAERAVEILAGEDVAQPGMEVIPHRLVSRETTARHT